MCIVKDLLTKEDLRHVKRILEILPEEAPIQYEVWAIGYANNSKRESLLRTFKDSTEAMLYANTVTLLDAINAITSNQYFNYDTDYVFIEVETSIDNHNGGSINLGVIYKNDLFVLEHIG